MKESASEMVWVFDLGKGSIGSPRGVAGITPRGEAVRNRFSQDFMFQISREEAAALRCQTGIFNTPPSDNSSQTVMSSALRSQTVTLKPGRGRHRKYLPYAFTEQGVAMLSSVLRSTRAVQVNIAIMRTFGKAVWRLVIANRQFAGGATAGAAPDAVNF